MDDKTLTAKAEFLVKEARLDAAAFRENTVYNADGDAIRLIANAERLEQYADTIEAQATRIEALEAALRDAERCLISAASLPSKDPNYQHEIEALGDRIGYGALMSGASRGWREKAKQDGLDGSEFVSGPCRLQAVNALEVVRKALESKP